MKSILIMIALTIPAFAQENRFALTAGQVAQTLSDSGMPTTPEQVVLSAGVVATEPNPALDVVSVERLKGEARVKVACRLPGACVPFFAIVKNLQGNVANDAMVKPKRQVIMRAGSHATLLMDDHLAHIQVAVISLENGVAGKWIRVASPDHKQTYMGEVVSENILRGTF